MSPPSRVPQFARLQQLLAKHYRPDKSAEDRATVLEHLIFAALLENAPHAAASEAFRRLRTEFFDWNEIRVSTLRDLSEIAAELPDPGGAALRIKQPLQSLFESTYSFDLEGLRKLTINQALERIDKIKGVTPFMRSYVVQHALGGHTIPLDDAALAVLFVAGLADESEMRTRSVAGLERAIPKNKGIAFAAMLHDWAAAFYADRRDPTVVKILKDLDANSLQRLQAWERQIAAASATAGHPAEAVVSVSERSAPEMSGGAEPKGKRRGRKPRVKAPDDAAEAKPAVKTSDRESAAASEAKTASDGMPRSKPAESDRPTKDRSRAESGKKAASKRPRKSGEHNPAKGASKSAPTGKSQRGDARKSARRKPR
ncbi:MAG: hypothetical protein ACUVQK_09750 [Thermogutta sp.]